MSLEGIFINQTSFPAEGVRYDDPLEILKQRLGLELGTIAFTQEEVDRSLERVNNHRAWIAERQKVVAALQEAISILEVVKAGKA